MSESPYIKETVVTIVCKYNPKFGDSRVCRCGHTYYRHFDSYENMEACGCKYCYCSTFVEATTEDIALHEELRQLKDEYAAHALPPAGRNDLWEKISELSRKLGSLTDGA